MVHADSVPAGMVCTYRKLCPLSHIRSNTPAPPPPLPPASPRLQLLMHSQNQTLMTWSSLAVVYLSSLYLSSEAATCEHNTSCPWLSWPVSSGCSWGKHLSLAVWPSLAPSFPQLKNITEHLENSWGNHLSMIVWLSLAPSFPQLKKLTERLENIWGNHLSLTVWLSLAPSFPQLKNITGRLKNTWATTFLPDRLAFSSAFLSPAEKYYRTIREQLGQPPLPDSLAFSSAFLSPTKKYYRPSENSWEPPVPDRWLSLAPSFPQLRRHYR